MADPRSGRAGRAGYSPRLGPRDPRLRGNQAAEVADADLGPGLSRDAAGRTRVSALDAVRPLRDGAGLPEVAAAVNAILAAFRQ